ncbi:hypothetical protein LTS18_005676, partial [Coniosporium uncinatum]
MLLPSAASSRRLTLLLSLFLLSLLTLLPSVTASSRSRNPITHLEPLKDARITTPSHRITSSSHFSLTFALHGRRVRLALEPNHDVIPEGAHINYL